MAPRLLQAEGKAVRRLAEVMESDPATTPARVGSEEWKDACIKYKYFFPMDFLNGLESGNK